jgi:protein TonB
MTQPTTLCCIAAVEVAGGSRARRLPLPEAPAANKPAKTAHVRELARRTANPTREARQAKASGTNAPTAQPMDRGTNSVAGNGSDAENKSPAFPIFSPHPPVRDRALLPASERQVVVDVRLNAGGEVVSENLVKGIGNALDQMVLDTVKTWRFQPATVNGQPVASEAEVIVPFNQSYPIANS